MSIKRLVPWFALFLSFLSFPAFSATTEPDLNLCPARHFGDTSSDDVVQDPPALLSQAGIFQDMAGLKPCPDLIAYEVRAPLWSEAAIKSRWIAVPAGEHITFHAKAPWEFPAGTLLVKQFDLKTSPQHQAHVETRVYFRAKNGEWYGYSYQWNDEQTDAVLLKDSATKSFEIIDQEGASPHSQSWYYPSRADCMQCHSRRAGKALGVRTEQLNFAFSGSGKKNQLLYWKKLGILSGVPSDVSHLPSLVNPEDESAPLLKRAKSYLAANCSHCHQPGGNVPTNIDLRFDTPLQQMKIVNQPPLVGNNFPNDFIVAPGKREDSVLWIRMRSLDKFRMPPLGTSVVDESAVELMGRWIDGLSSRSN